MTDGEMVQKRLEEEDNDNGRDGDGVFGVSKGKTQPNKNLS